MNGDTYVVAIDGLSADRPLDALPRQIERAALMAVNRTAERTRTASARKIREQVNFPARYLSGQDGRLKLSKAKTAEDGATITGQFRPTSLARFATSGTVGGKNGVRVEVAPGFAKMMRRAFLIRLPAGKGGVDTKSNLGLAIRLRAGEKLQNKTTAVALGKSGVVLLFGASVSQVFRSVRDEQIPEAEEFLSKEFARLLELDL